MEKVKPTCIIVDDEPPNHKALEMYLAEDGRLATIGSCFDAFAAMELIRSKKPDLVFLDVQMPGKTGLQMLEQSPDLQIAVILYTASKVDSKALADKRIKGVLPKLCGPEDFSCIVTKAIAELDQ